MFYTQIIFPFSKIKQPVFDLLHLILFNIFYSNSHENSENGTTFILKKLTFQCVTRRSEKNIIKTLKYNSKSRVLCYKNNYKSIS